MTALAESLSPLERAVLPALEKASTIAQLRIAAKLQDVEVLRGLNYLEAKGLAKVNVKLVEEAVLEENGLAYAKNGLPERRFLSNASKQHSPVADLQKKAGLSAEEVNACLGVLRQRGLIEIRKDKALTAALTAAGEKALKAQFAEERLLQQKFPMQVGTVQDKEALENLKRRGIIRVEQRKERTATLTPLGRELLAKKLVDTIEKVTPDILAAGAWKGKTFRRYDVTGSLPKAFSGRRHFVHQAMEYIRSIWLEMGFTEMQGNLVQTAFWNLDTLFVPQDHPARDMQDTFYVKQPSHGTLPALAAKVKKAHEKGVAGSSGWQGRWSEQIASQNLLRTHCTVLSSRTLAALKETDIPAKFFSVGRVFRNETPDWKHLFEFNQVEGIVIDERANLRHLFGYLKTFYAKMGFPDVRMKPTYYPFTEPSLEVSVWHPTKKQWIELGGAGIFRPEVVEPLLGKDIPVLAWGQGMERIITEYYAITDLRELYRNDVRQLREIKEWTR
ncbi:phenylalanine--tRNA ligase subunit alpha [Candidatus Woesearchaeota archaeon]|nr:phenylalanine--tRNA ligase subunit alpha [Candidatus Woesearchaeota archaeon]